MSVILDILGSTVMLGSIILTILGINVNMNTETTKSAEEFHMQTELVQLGRILEFDYYKIGYDVPIGTRKIITADTSHLKFKTNLWNGVGEVDSV